MNNLDIWNTEAIRSSAYEIASNEIDNRGIADRERDKTRDLAAYLVDNADEWASFDLNELKEDETNAVIARYFGE